MARIEVPITIKRYGNSRLYNANVGRSVSLQDLASKVEDDNEFVVHDVKSGEDITTIVLKQIIAERVHHG
jgi:polyhydroxyalkanoate synthesis repressor PhaR